jgi:diguanylate cyclase (GGDEF)-like protein
MLPSAATGVSLRAIARGLLRPREDPYAADDIWLARRIAGLVSTITGLMGVAFLALDPPTAAIGSAGWAGAAVIVAGTVGGAARLLDARQAVTFDQLYALSYLGILATVGMIWLAGAGDSPYAALYPVIVAGSALNPPRRSLPFIATCAMASVAQAGVDAVPYTLGWVVVGCLIVLAADAIRQQRLALIEDARVDLLTGLGNRRAFEETLAAELSRVRRVPAPLAVALFDLDGLKGINDRLGHLEGDAALRKVAGALLMGVRGSDRAYRWAGDEFAVLFPNTTADEAAAVCERLRDRAAASSFTSHGEPLLLSYGVAELVDGDPVTLLTTADTALFNFKAARPELAGY